MTARGSRNGSPNTVHHRLVATEAGGVLPNKEKLRAAAPPLSIPTAAACDDIPPPRLSRKRHSVTRKLPWATTTTERTEGLGALFLFVFFFVSLLMLWRGGGHNSLWQQFTSLIGVNTLDEGGFRPDEEFLTSEDYAATLEPGKPNGAACYTAANCLEGSICAFPTLHNNSARICCADAVMLNDPVNSNIQTASSGTGTKKFGLDNNNNDETNSPWLSVCTSAQLGEPCGTYDAICDSGHCLFGKCAAAALADRQVCQDDADCQSGACAFYGDDLRDDPRCCPGGKAVTVKPAHVPFEISYCADLPNGVFCGEHDELCASGWCSHGMCRDANVRRQRPQAKVTTSAG
eukprot:scaffold40822_cov168-Amphora_coffeaeformis.AAC.1